MWASRFFVILSFTRKVVAWDKIEINSVARLHEWMLGMNETVNARHDEIANRIVNQSHAEGKVIWRTHTNDIKGEGKMNWSLSMIKSLKGLTLCKTCE